MENQYIKQFPDLMKGKKVMYVHGFGSSGQSGTVGRMREVMPNATVIAPDLPVRPQEALALLRDVCEREKPDLILGTSMGGMYAEMLYGYDRILINPAFEIGDTMVSHNIVGKQTFQNPRADGVQEFMVTKALVKEYKEMTLQNFSGVTEDESLHRVTGLFGDEDTLVDTRDMFCRHYKHAISFHGEHRMSDKSFMHSVLPVIRWYDDRQQRRERPIIYVSIDALRDRYGKPLSSSQKTLRRLAESYALYVVAPAETNSADSMPRVVEWATEYIGVLAYDRVVFVENVGLLYGDYLVAPSSLQGGDRFMGTHIDFGSDTFKTWEETSEFFERLGGQ